ncbi:MAG: hypothetical protein VYB46_11810 [Pseudomonadota bacterium]|nr:hypothetical protein [Pseudomonadota bacterium]
MYAEAHACAQVFIADCKNRDPNDPSPDSKLWLWEAGAPTLRAQINYEAVQLGQMPDIWRRARVLKPTKQNDRRDPAARRYLMGYGNDDATAGQIRYGPSGIKGPAGDMWLVQWGRPAPSRQEVVCNDETTAGKVWYDAAIRQHGATGARIETFAYSSDSAGNKTSYYRAADGVAIWWLLRAAMADSFDPTVSVIGGASRLYNGEPWVDSSADAQIAVTKTGWTTGWADDAAELSSADWQATCAEIFDRFLAPRPASPAYTSLERGALSAAPQTVRAPTGFIHPPFGFIRPSSPAAGNTISAYKATWARGVWNASYPLTYSFQWVIDDAPHGAATSAFADLVVPDIADNASHTIKLRITATNSAGSDSCEVGLGSFAGTGDVTNPPGGEAGGTYFTDFSEFTPGDLVAPWSHVSDLGSHFRFIDRSGDMTIGEGTVRSGDAAAYYNGLSADLGEYLELYTQGTTTYSGSSSLEWALGYSPDNSNLAALLYRVNIDTSADNLRLRRREAYEPGSTGSRTDTLATVPFAVNPNDLVHFLGRVQQIDATTTNIKIKTWVDGQPEPASWMIDFDHSERPVPAPLYAGVFQNTANASAWHTVFGVGINEPAPRTLP